MFEFVKADQITLQHTKGAYVSGHLTHNLDHHRRSESQVGALAVYAENLHAFVDFLQTHCAKPQRAMRSSSPKSYGSGKFFALNSYEEALDVYLNRPYEVRKFKAKDDQIKIPDTAGNDVFYDVTGDYLDIDRYLEGQPEDFGNMTLGNPNSIFCLVVINLAMIWYVPEEAVRRRGERLVRLIDWLENKKIRCAIKAFASNDCVHLEMGIKDYTEALDLDTIAVVSHPDFYRRLVFRTMEYSPTYNSSYAMQTLLHLDSLRMPRIEHNNGILLFTENHEHATTVDRNFNKVERDIETMLFDGDKYFSMAV
jgi:hypothetical protein